MSNIIENIIENLSDKNFKNRLKAVHELSYFKSEKAFKALLNALTDTEAKIRSLAVKSLNKYAYEWRHEVIEAAINLLADEDNDVAMSAAELISEASDSKTSDSLLKYIENIGGKINIYAVLACGKTMGDKLKDKLVKTLKISEDKKLTAAIIKALGASEEPRFLDILAPYLKDGDVRIKSSAIEAISHLKLKKEIFIELFKPMLDENNARIVANSCIALFNAGDRNAFKKVETLIKSNDKWARASGCYVLGNIESHKCAPLLLSLKNDIEADVRLNVARSLYNIKTKEAAGALIEMIADGDQNVKSNVMNLILKINYKEAFWPVSEMLKSPHHSLKIIAASVLCNINDPAAITVISETIKGETEENIKNELKKYLNILKENSRPALQINDIEKPRNTAYSSTNSDISLPEELMPKEGHQETITDTIISKLFHKSQFLREEAAFELSYVESEKAVFALMKGLGDSVGKVRSVCARSITKHCMKFPKLLPGIKEKLIELLYDDYNEAAQHAAQTLGYIRDKNSIPALLEILNHDNPNTRLYAAMALGKMNDKSVIKPLVELLHKDKNKKVRATLLTALGNLEEAENLPIILKFGLNDNDPHVRASTIEAISKLKIPFEKVSEIIIKKLDDPNNRVVANACLALWKLGDLSAMEHITKLVKNPDKWFRASASYILGQIANVEATNILISLKNDPEIDVRLNVAKSLGNIKNTKAITALIEMLDDSDEIVKTTAYDAIIKCNDKFAFWCMAQYLKSPYEILRYIATVVLCNIGDLACVSLIIEALSKEKNAEVKGEILKFLTLLIQKNPQTAFKEIFGDVDKNASTLEESLKILEKLSIENSIKIELCEKASGSSIKKVAKLASDILSKIAPK